jgi:hypothetical protein
MTWQQAIGLLRLIAEETIGAPSRRAEEERQAGEIERMRAKIGVADGAG